MATVEKPERPRKKFAKPPVKNACLACRASRTRCDGKETCTTCVTKGKECRYTSSKRGGPRFSKRNAPSSKASGDSTSGVSASPTPLIYDDEYFQQATTFGAPGAGLRNLDTQMNFDFEANNILWDINNLGLSTTGISSNFSNENFEQYNTSTESPSDSTADSYVEEKPMSIRTYTSDENILEAYYVFIHAYFPILPPPVEGPTMDRPLAWKNPKLWDYKSSSPLCLAILAILSLIPCAEDPFPKSPQSVKRRRQQAQHYVQKAVECMEAESELPDSFNSPSLALQSSGPTLAREPFHPNTPVQLESLLALLLLSNYEYTQRGNLHKMRSRAGQAMVIAMDMQLYKETGMLDQYTEAKRRAWWMTYVSVCQGSITSNTRPTIAVYDPRFTVAHPSSTVDGSEAWSLLIKAEQVILAATQFVIDLKETLEAGKDLTDIYVNMRQLETEIQPLVAAVESLVVRSAVPMSVFPTEDIVVKSLRGIARIKLNSARIKVHRYCAFMDMPIFSQRHCDLKATNQSGSQRSSQTPNMSCCQDSLRELVENGPESVSQAQPSRPQAIKAKPPFSTNFSANICRVSALAIANAFSTLPLPNPSGSLDLPSAHIPPLTKTLLSHISHGLMPAPRTMPSFACCAMQSAYAMLMLCYKAHAIALPNPVVETGFEFSGAGSGMELLMRSYVDQLTTGLRLVLSALENYSIAFEAIDGMRDQIGEALVAAAASFEGDGMEGDYGSHSQQSEYHGNGVTNGSANGTVSNGWTEAS